MNRDRYLNAQERNPSIDAESLDRLLTEQLASPSEHLTPSSGFVLSVMESIQAQTAEPPPIAFPWRRTLPGAIAAVCGLIALIVLALRPGNIDTPASRHWAGILATRIVRALSLHADATQIAAALCWSLLATLLSIAAVAASFRLTGRSE